MKVCPKLECVRRYCPSCEYPEAIRIHAVSAADHHDNHVASILQLVPERLELHVFSLPVPAVHTPWAYSLGAGAWPQEGEGQQWEVEGEDRREGRKVADET